MPRLIVKANSENADSVVELNRPRVTIGRSARNDLWTDDPFTSRLHAEIRQRGDDFWLSDMGSANGTYFNSVRLTTSVVLRDRDVVKVGETEIIFIENEETSPLRKQTGVLIAPQIFGDQLQPEATIMPTSSQATNVAVSRLLSSIDTSQTTTDGLHRIADNPSEVLAVISRVSLALLSSLSLDETLHRVLDSIFEALPADQGYLMLFERNPDTKQNELICKARKMRKPKPDSETEDVKISHSISELVLGQGNSVLTSDAQHDPRFQQHQSVVLSGIRSVMAVPLMMDSKCWE